MKKLLIFIFILFLLSGCINNTKTNTYKIINKVEFNPGFSSLSKFTGSYFDSEKKKEFIYFADPISKKCIKIFDFDGNFIDSVPTTNTGENSMEEMDGISIFSKDSIFLTFSALSKIIQINNKGEVINDINIHKIITDTLKYKYLLCQSYYPNIMPRSNKLLFKIWPLNYDVMQKNEEDISEIISKEYFFFSELYNTPFFVGITDFYNIIDTKIKYGPYDFYKEIYGNSSGKYNGEFFDISNFFKYIGENIYLLTSHSDHIYKINGENLNYIDKYKIKSEYTTLGIKPFIIDSYLQNNNQKRIDSKQSIKEFINGMIENIFFNENKKEYYVFVTHSLKDLEECLIYGTYGQYRPFSIIVYNENFENPREYAFEGNLYFNRISFVIDEGIMILKKNNNEKYGKQIFDIINFN